MAPSEDAGSTPLLDEWIAQAGADAVASELAETRRRIAEGTLPSFDNSTDLLAFVRRGRRQRA